MVSASAISSPEIGGGATASAVALAVGPAGDLLGPKTSGETLRLTAKMTSEAKAPTAAGLGRNVRRETQRAHQPPGSRNTPSASSVARILVQTRGGGSSNPRAALSEITARRSARITPQKAHSLACRMTAGRS